MDIQPAVVPDVTLLHCCCYKAALGSLLSCLRGNRHPNLKDVRDSSCSRQLLYEQQAMCDAALVGALGITPIDFVLPLAMYIFLRKPKGWKLWLNWFLMVFYICIMIIGAVAAIRGIVLDACE